MPLNLRRRKRAFALSSTVLAIQCHCPILFSPLASEVSCAPSFCRLNTYLKFVNLMALETWLINSRMEHSSLNHQASQLPGTRSQVILCLSTKPVQSLAGGRKVTFVTDHVTGPCTVPLGPPGAGLSIAEPGIRSALPSPQSRTRSPWLPARQEIQFSEWIPCFPCTGPPWQWNSLPTPFAAEPGWRWTQTRGNMACCPLTPNSDTWGQLGLEAAAGCLPARETDSCFSGKTTTTLCSQDGQGLPKLGGIAPVLSSCFRKEALFSGKSRQHCWMCSGFRNGNCCSFLVFKIHTPHKWKTRP